MPIDKLSSTAGIIAALRAEMNQRSERTDQKGAKRAETPGALAAPRDIKVLRKQLVDIVKPVSIDDPAAVRKVRPQVVRAILLWEFGAALREHPEWQPMLESVTENLEAHPPHEVQFLKLLSDLKR